MELGLKGGARGEGDLSYNPRRRIVQKGTTSERDEYYKLMAKDLDDPLDPLFVRKGMQQAPVL